MYNLECLRNYYCKSWTQAHSFCVEALRIFLEHWFHWGNVFLLTYRNCISSIWNLFPVLSDWQTKHTNTGLTVYKVDVFHWNSQWDKSLCWTCDDRVVRRTKAPLRTSTGNINFVWRHTVNPVFVCVVCFLLINKCLLIESRNEPHLAQRIQSLLSISLQ